MEINIELTQFEGIDFNSDQVSAYVEFWGKYMSEMEINDDQKEELAKAWQLLSIRCANDEQLLSRYPYFVEVVYEIFANIVLNGGNELDWDDVIHLIKTHYPPYNILQENLKTEDGENIDMSKLGALKHSLSVIMISDLGLEKDNKEEVKNVEL